jgi:uncharacterized protein (DUF2147 family)
MRASREARRPCSAASSVAASAPASAQRTKPEGAWIGSDRVAIQVFDCSGSVCGRIVWLRNPMLRTAEMCGKTIIWGLAPDGPAHWSNAWFFDPENRGTYNLSAELQSPGQDFRPDLQGRFVVRTDRDFGRTEILTRIPPRSLQGWC